MVVEERTYTLQIGKLSQFYEYYGTNGLPIQQRILGKLLGFFHSDIGELNQVIQLWSYDSYAERERRRGILAKDPDWLHYLKYSPPIIVSQQNRILVPAPFSPIK
jgi:hypothetical protein